jgi:hypothetical protein
MRPSTEIEADARTQRRTRRREVGRCLRDGIACYVKRLNWNIFSGSFGCPAGESSSSPRPCREAGSGHRRSACRGILSSAGSASGIDQVLTARPLTVASAGYARGNPCPRRHGRRGPGEGRWSAGETGSLRPDGGTAQSGRGRKHRIAPHGAHHGHPDLPKQFPLTPCTVARNQPSAPKSTIGCGAVHTRIRNLNSRSR